MRKRPWKGLLLLKRYLLLPPAIRIHRHRHHRGPDLVQQQQHQRLQRQPQHNWSNSLSKARGRPVIKRFPFPPGLTLYDHPGDESRLSPVVDHAEEVPGVGRVDGTEGQAQAAADVDSDAAGIKKDDGLGTVKGGHLGLVETALLKKV